MSGIDKFITRFEKRVKDFCRLSYEFGQNQNEQMKKRNILNSEYKSIWNRTTERKNAQVTVPGAGPIKFAYSYDVLKFQSESFHKYANSLSSYDEFFFHNFLKKYFKEQVHLNSMLYQLLERKEDLKIEEVMRLLKIVIGILNQPPVPLFEYTVTILKEFLNFLGFIVLDKIKKMEKKIVLLNMKDENEDEGEGGEKPMRRSQLMMDVLNLIICQKSVQAMIVPMFSPSPMDMLEEDFITIIYNAYTSKILSEETTIQILKKLPFNTFLEMKVKAHEVMRYIIEPIKRLFLHGQPSTKIMIQVYKIMTSLTKQYPDYCLEFMAIMTRGCRWPGRYLSLVFVSDFPFKKIDVKKNFPFILREVYNLYNKKLKELESKQKLSHQNTFLNEYLLPWSHIILELYSKYPTLKKKCEDLQFPFVRILSKMASAAAGVDDAFFEEIVNLLLSIAFKSGTKNRAYLKLLGNLRQESLIQVINIFKNNPKSKINLFVKLLVVNYIPFILQTQPTVMNKLFDVFIKKIPLKRWILTEHDLKVIMVLMQGKDRLNVFKKQFVMAIDWSKQNGDICFNFLMDLMENHRKLMREIGNDILKDFNIPFESEEKVKKYLEMVKYKNDELGAFNSLRIYLSLLICEEKMKRYLEQKKKEEEGEEKEGEDGEKKETPIMLSDIRDGLVLIKENISHGKMGGIFTPVILKKYLLISMEFENDLNFASSITVFFRNTEKTSSKFLSTLNINFDELEKNGSKYNKCVQSWSFAILSSCTISSQKILNELVKGEIRKKRDLSPIIKSIQLFGRNNQKLVLDFVNSEWVWLAYAFTKAYTLQIPPLENNDKDGFVDTSVECGMWIALEAGQKLIEKKKVLESLKFFEFFFQSYFMCVRNYGATTFPMYLRQRLGKTFNSVSESSSNEKVSTLFGSFCMWNPHAILGGESFFEEFRDIVFPEEKKNKDPIDEKEEEIDKEDDDIEEDDGEVKINRKPFYKEITRYNKLRMKIDESFSNVSLLDVISTDQQQLFSSNLLSLFDRYSETLSRYSLIKKNHFRMTKTMFHTISSTSQTKLKGPEGKMILTEFPIQKSVYTSEEIKLEIEENDKEFIETQKQFLDVMERIAFLYSSLRKVTDEMMEFDQFQSTAMSFFFSVLPYLLDLRKGAEIGLIYEEIVNFMCFFGRKMVCMEKKLQRNLLETFLTKLEEEGESQILERWLKLKPSPKVEEEVEGEEEKEIIEEEIDLKKLEEGESEREEEEIDESVLKNFSRIRELRLRLYDCCFSPEIFFEGISIEEEKEREENLLSFNSLMENDEDENEKEEEKLVSSEYLVCVKEYLELVNQIITSSTKISTLATKEMSVIIKKFNFDSIFLTLASTRSPGSRFIKTLEIKMIIRALQRSLSSELLCSSLGHTLLRKCVEIAFPLELQSFLKLVLSLSKGRKYNLKWDSIFKFQNRLMSEVSPEVAANWLETIDNYQPINNSNNSVSLLRFTKHVVLETQIYGLIKRSDITSPYITNTMKVLKGFLSSPENVTVSEFRECLNTFKELLTSFPFLIDIAWEMYVHVFHVFIQKKVKSGGDVLKLRQEISSLLQTINWKEATFHEGENSVKFLDEMYMYLIYDPAAVAIMFSKLDWSFLFKSNNSNVLTRFIRLYFDINLLNKKFATKEISDWINEDEYAVEDPLIGKILPHQFSELLNNEEYNSPGNVFIRLMVNVTIRSDPTDGLFENLQWMRNYISRTSGKGGEMLAETFGREIYNVLFLEIRENGSNGKSWFLRTSKNVELLLDYLIPIGEKYYFNQTILSAIFLSIEKVIHSLPILVNGKVPFAIPDFPPGENEKLVIANKFKGLIEQFCSKLNNEELCKSVFSVLPKLDGNLVSLVTKCQLLEKVLNRYLKIINQNQIRDEEEGVRNRSSEDSKELAGLNGPFVLPSPSDESRVYEKMILVCYSQHCPILLTLMLHRSIEISKLTRDSDKIRSTLVWAFDNALKYVPKETNFFDMMYLLLYMIDMVENDEYDPENSMVVSNQIKAFQKLLNYLMEQIDRDDPKTTTEKGWKIMKSLVSWKKTEPPNGWKKEMKIPIAVSLSARLFDIYIEKLLRSKKLTSNLSNMNRLMNSNQSYLNHSKVGKLAKLKDKYSQFNTFFSDIENIDDFGPLDFFTLKLILQKLFPLSLHLFK